MAPDSRNKSSNPIQRLLETEEKGRGLALFGWAGVTVFAFLAAFASWQFAPARAVTRLARMDETTAGDITGGITPSVRPPVTHTPTPLAGDASFSRDDIDQLRADLKDLRRMVGRIDASTDVLARRISNLEDSVGNGPTASTKQASKPLLALTPITPPVQVANTAPANAIPPAPPPASSAPASSHSSTTSATAAPTVTTPAAATPPPGAGPLVQSPQSAANPPQSVSVVPQNGVETRPPVTSTPHPLTPPVQQTDKTQLDRSAVDRSQLEQMLMQRAQVGDPDNGSEASTYIPPLPDPISVVPKTRSPLVLPPQPLPAQPSAQVPGQPAPGQPALSQQPGQPVAKVDTKPPASDVATTGSVQQKPVLPIDPTKAVVVKPPLTPPVAAEMSPEDQKKASEKMALAMRGEQTAAAKPPAEPVGIDLGGYKSIGQVKKVWADFEIRQGKLAKALTPLARLGEATDGVEIRLIIGPFPNSEQAIRTCHQLRGTTAKCDTVAYVGESIQTKPVPQTERKPSAPEFATQPPLKLDLPNKPVPPKYPTP